MTEEEKKDKEEKAEPKKAEAAKEAKPEEQKEKTAPGEKKKKKINRLSLKELEKKLKETEQKMGSLTSSYAQQLLKRKAQLLQSTENRVPSFAKVSEGKQKAEETTESGGENAANL